MTKLNRLFKPGDRVRIIKDAAIWQDRQWKKWPDIEEHVDTIFNLEKYERQNYARLIAEGYGYIDINVKCSFYGNGAIIVEDKYLEKT
jgi:hypothetical protein